MPHTFASLGRVTAVIGAQWGDEGKGKIIDRVSEHFDVIARACGGANAGHTIVVDGIQHIFHLLPAGSLHAGKPLVLGAGMVIHLPTLLEEIRMLEKSGLEILPRIHLSPAAHIVFDYHKEIDVVQEERRSRERGQGIGTTQRGIGPAYMEKAARSGLRLEALRLSDEQLEEEVHARASLIQEAFGVTVNVAKEVEALHTSKRTLEHRIVAHTADLMHGFLAAGKSVLIEGAQATLLDLDHGTYPYVTSSQTTAAGALQGLGLPPKVLASCIGVAKAYCTRVGAGTFLTEVEGVIGDRLRKRGGEYGATTGRPRRCGWLHLPDLHYAARINGFSCWNMTKLDVLDEENEIPVGVSSDSQGKVHYKNLPGWKCSTRGVTSFESLPREARSFISFIEEQTCIPVDFIGTGQGRQEMIVRTP